jgi:hypothetical protein
MEGHTIESTPEDSAARVENIELFDCLKYLPRYQTEALVIAAELNALGTNQ